MKDAIVCRLLDLICKHRYMANRIQLANNNNNGRSGSRRKKNQFKFAKQLNSLMFVSKMRRSLLTDKRTHTHATHITANESQPISKLNYYFAELSI